MKNFLIGPKPKEALSGNIIVPEGISNEVFEIDIKTMCDLYGELVVGTNNWLITSVCGDIDEEGMFSGIIQYLAEDYQIREVYEDGKLTLQHKDESDNQKYGDPISISWFDNGRLESITYVHPTSSEVLVRFMNDNSLPKPLLIWRRWYKDGCIAEEHHCVEASIGNSGKVRKSIIKRMILEDGSVKYLKDNSYIHSETYWMEKETAEREWKRRKS